MIRSLAQLYPVLISPWFIHGYVPGDLVNAHIFNAWEKYPIYDMDRAGNWYDFGFLAGAGSPFFGMFNARGRSSRSNGTYST